MINSPEEIQKERERIRKNIYKWEKKLEELQHNICSHPNKETRADSNTGNYDPSEDLYWYVHKCPDCGLCWTEDQ